MSDYTEQLARVRSLLAVDAAAADLWQRWGIINDDFRAVLAERRLAEMGHQQGIAANQLAVHADRGTSRASKPVALLLAVAPEAARGGFVTLVAPGAENTSARGVNNLVGLARSNARNSGGMFGEPLPHHGRGPEPVKGVGVALVILRPGGRHMVDELRPAPPRAALEVVVAERFDQRLRNVRAGRNGNFEAVRFSCFARSIADRCHTRRP